MSVTDISSKSGVHSICSVSSRPISKPSWSKAVLAPEPCEAHLADASAETHSRIEVADILRRFAPSYAQTHSVSPFEQRLIDDLIACRTASLGGHIEHCPQCGFKRQAYNSCRNRHCPKCQTVTKCDGSRPDAPQSGVPLNRGVRLLLCRPSQHSVGCVAHSISGMIAQ